MITLVFTVLLGNAFVGGVAAQQEKRVVEMPIIADVRDMPTTLDGFVARSDAVVIARARTAEDRSMHRRAKTVYRMRLVSAMKEHAQLAAEFNVCRAVGRLEQPDRVVKVYQPHMPDFEVGGEYLLFLSWNDEQDCFFPSLGPPSMVMFGSSGKAKSYAKHPVTEGLTGLDREQVRTRVAAAQR